MSLPKGRKEKDAIRDNSEFPSSLTKLKIIDPLLLGTTTMYVSHITIDRLRVSESTNLLFKQELKYV